MARQVATRKDFTFVKGLNTEAGPLTFPPNTWSDGDNTVPNIDGSLQRRLAVNYESSYALSSTTDTPTEETTGAFTCGEWNSVGGEGSRNYVVVQRNDLITFYDNTGDTISSTEKSFTIDLSSYKAAGNPNSIGYSPISCASANGNLIITSADTEPLLVGYVSSSAISVSAITLRIRDLYGVTDTLTVAERSASITDAHRYNLYNQGWDATKVASYQSSTGYYPSNAQSWPAGKDSSDVFDPTLLDKQDFGTSPAPKGRFVLPLFSRDRTSASGVPSITTETETYRPTTCAFYAGRAWYAGTNSSTIGTWVLFSQVADTTTKFGYCYQDADPTSEVISDLVATDGGVIPIQDAGTILKLLPAYNSLLVFADNGVWQILGSIDGGFSATSYEVRRLSSVGCVSRDSVVEAETTIYYWARDGIWTIVPTQTGGFSVQNITNTTIQSLYASIPANGKAYSFGRYYQEGKTIYWLYNSDTSQDGINRRFKKDSMLCVDLRLAAPYTHTVSSLASNSPYIVAALITKNKTSTSTTFNVVDASENQVIDGSSNTVVASLTPDVLRNSEVRFMVQAPQSAGASFKTTFARFEDGLTAASKFKDWYAANTAGVTYDSYILTGADLGNGQGGDKAIQGLYLVAFFNRTETGVDSNGDPTNPSSCTLQARWDWTDSTAAGKWTPGEEIYRHRRPFFPAVPSATYNDGYPVVVSKSKIRGRGKAVQFKFTAHPTKDMQLLGWAVTFMGNTNV